MSPSVITGWFLEAFGPDGALAGDYPLPGVDTEEVRELTGAPPEDPMYGAVWPLPAERLEWAEQLTGLELDPAGYYYLDPEVSWQKSPDDEPPPDPPTVAELLERRLAEDVSHDQAQELENDVARRGVEEALPAAERLLESDSPFERAAGAGILRASAALLGEEGRAAAVPRLVRVLEAESEPAVLARAVHGIEGLRYPGGERPLTPGAERALEPILRLVENPDEKLRFAVAVTLPYLVLSTGDDRGVRALIKMTADPYEEVRYRATSGLGLELEVDTAEVRRALEERRADEDFYVRSAARYGLAIRGDVEALAEELADPDIDLFKGAERAAAPELYEPLLAVKAGAWRGDSEDLEHLERAIAACRPEHEGVGSA